MNILIPTQSNSSPFETNSSLTPNVNATKNYYQDISPKFEMINNETLSNMLDLYMLSVDTYLNSKKQGDFQKYTLKKHSVAKIINRLKSDEIRVVVQASSVSQTEKNIQKIEPQIKGQIELVISANEQKKYYEPQFEKNRQGIRSNTHKSIDLGSEIQLEKEITKITNLTQIRNESGQHKNTSVQQLEIQVFNLNKKLIVQGQKELQQKQEIKLIQDQSIILKQQLDQIQSSILKLVQVHYPKSEYKSTEKLLQILDDHIQQQYSSIQSTDSQQNKVQIQIKFLNQENLRLAQQNETWINSNKNLEDEMKNLNQLAEQKRESHTKQLQKYHDQLEQREGKILVQLVQIEKLTDDNLFLANEKINVLKIIDRLSSDNQCALVEMQGLKQSMRGLET